MKTTTKKPVKQVFIKLNKKVASCLKHVNVSPMNGDNPNDRLELLKTKCEQEIQAKEQELAALKAKLRNLVEFGEEADRLKEPEAAQDKYANQGMTEAVLDATDTLWRMGRGTQEGVTASQIRDYMILHGFTMQANPHNFSIAVNVTLKRLVASGRLSEFEFVGKNYYKTMRHPTGSSLRLNKRRERRRL